MKKISLLCLVALAATVFGLSSCSKDDDNNEQSPVQVDKKHDTAILLCTFGSTYELPQSSYNAIVGDYQKRYPNADVYLSFTSRTCVSRVGASIGKYYAQPDLWLSAIGKAGYKTVGVQSLHVIPGEEYLSLMNTDVKKNFMIPFADVRVAKGACLLSEDELSGGESDVDAVAKVLFNEFCKDKVAKGEFVIFMGHGNPDKEYSHANNRYLQVQKALQDLDGGRKRIFVGTVDYGDMMFSYIRKELAEATGNPQANNPVNGLGQQPDNGIVLHLAPMMSVAGDHAHNDMAGDLDDNRTLADVDPYEPDHEAEYSWKLKLRKLGYTVKEENCHMIGLADYASLRAIWMGHLDLSTAESWNEHLGE
ncbi:MAG: sirohydrochlorin cobaltochelatase [Bacteroidales bacterium]|nr:sirohydrochlorin cobaltochelatase [Bacteroidales bacterium]MBN2750971.1 sirohydrochlorin cobaltochelatase [Bacteroidales bacterium]